MGQYRLHRGQNKTGDFVVPQADSPQNPVKTKLHLDSQFSESLGSVRVSLRLPAEEQHKANV